MKGGGAEVGPGVASLEVMIKGRPCLKLHSDLCLLLFIYCVKAISGFQPRY